MSKVPIPQANNLELVYEILRDFPRDGESNEMLMNRKGLAKREASYYLDALLFLNFVEKIKKKYFLVESGLIISNATQINARKSFTRLLLDKEILRTYYDKVVTGTPYSQISLEIVQDLKMLEELSDSTLKRRTSTLISWIKWLVKEDGGV